MIDIKWIAEDPEKIKAGAKKKHIDVDIDALLKLNEDRKKKLQKFENVLDRYFDFEALYSELGKADP